MTRAGGVRGVVVLGLAGALVVAGGGCSKCGGESSPDASAGPAASSSTSSDAGGADAASSALVQGRPRVREPAATGTDLRALLCQSRAKCMLLPPSKAGKDPRDGRERSLVVVRVSAGAADPEVDGERNCEPFEVWLVTQHGAVFAREQLLAANCTRDPHMPVVSVNGEVARIDFGGVDVPSTWIGEELAYFHLSPPFLERTRGIYSNRLQACPSEHVSRERGGFDGEVIWQGAASCADAAESPPGVCRAGRRFAYETLPQVALPQSFEEGGWKTTGLGECAARVDGSAGNGYLISGTSAGPADASMRVVLSSHDVLYVEITDDHWVGPGARWVDDDHVALWYTDTGDDYMSHCVLPGSEKKPKQWAVRVADAKVFTAGGDDPAALSAERAQADGTVRLRIALARAMAQTLRASELGALTVAYSDSDGDPGKRKSLLATSRLEPGDRSTLGRVTAVDTGTSCILGAAVLERSYAQGPRDKALYPLDALDVGSRDGGPGPP